MSCTAPIGRSAMDSCIELLYCAEKPYNPSSEVPFSNKLLYCCAETTVLFCNELLCYCHCVELLYSKNSGLLFQWIAVLCATPLQ
jgi:hypothetical protein